MITKMIDGIVNNEDLTVQERIDQLNVLEMNTHVSIEDARKKLSESYSYCPCCRKDYRKTAWRNKSYDTWTKEEQYELLSNGKRVVKNGIRAYKVRVHQEICPIGHIFEAREFLNEGLEWN